MRCELQLATARDVADLLSLHTAVNERLIAQSGTFVIPGIIDQPLEQLLMNYKGAEKMVTKFILNTKAIRDEAMSYFHVTNINESTLFPGIDGMARALA